MSVLPRVTSRFLAGALAVVAATACRAGSKPAPSGPLPASSTTTAAAPSASSATTATAPSLSASVPAARADTVRTVRFPSEQEGARKGAFLAIDGALLVANANKITRIVGDKLEPVGQVPAASAFGATRIRDALGVWPDRVEVMSVSSADRAPEPTYFPLTGQGRSVTVGKNGVRGEIGGIATVGPSTVLSTCSQLEGCRFETVRGPRLERRSMSRAKGGCPPGAEAPAAGTPASPALEPLLLAGTPAGTMLAFGRRCDRTPAVEIWDAQGKSRLETLDGQFFGWRSRAFVMGPDELWIFGGGKKLVRYREGKLSYSAELASAGRDAFLSPAREVHVFDGKTLFRLANDAWVPVVRLAWSNSGLAFGIESETLWGADVDTFGPMIDAPSIADVETCETPFVYLSNVASRNAPTYTFPTTRKALASFPEAGDLGLVEFRAEQTRRLGVTVKSRAQGQALIAHVEATMKDEHPTLLCLRPESPRNILLSGDAPTK